MTIEFIQIGQFQICLVSHTPKAQACLVDFLSHLPGNLCVAQETTAGTKWVMHIIDSETVDVDAPNAYTEGPSSRNKVYQAGLSMGSHGMGSFFCVRSQLGEFETEFIHFMSPGRSTELERLSLIVHLTKIIQRFLMVNGNTSLHACTVVHNGFGFLFLGPSGSGKSTVAALSRETSRILHDEKIFLTPHEGKYILSRLPVFNESYDSAEENVMVRSQTGTNSNVYSLSGIFVLKKDETDCLRPIPQMNAAHSLMASFFELPRIFTLSRQEVQSTFQTLSQVARDIPAYELHFRKSPDFWKLIDEQFPD